MRGPGGSALCAQDIKAGASRSSFRRAVVVGAVLIAVAHFLRVRSYGFYEDDYAYVVEPLQWTVIQLWRWLGLVLTTWPQGRPLGFALPQLAAFVAAATPHPILALYVLAYLVLLLNYSLMLALSWQESRTLAFLSAAVLAVWPADTTHILLTHSFQLQTSLAFVLTGLLLLKRRKPVLAHAVSALSLLT